MNDQEKFDQLVELVADLRSGESRRRNTSIRLPGKLHQALQTAVELGMDESMTDATTQALLRRVEDFVDLEARVSHYLRHPEESPSLAAVARMRADFVDDPAGNHPELIDEVADWWEEQHGPWALSRDEYDPPNQVLDAVLVLATYPERRGGTS